MPTLGLEHDKIWAQWASNVPSESMLEKGMMVQMIRNGILKLNHLLFNELFKWKKTCMS